MYSYPEDACYIETDDSNLGPIEIYVPCDKVTSFAWDGDDLINVTSSTVTGYMNYGGTDYSVSFQPYQLGRYRLSNSGTYSYLEMYDTYTNFQTRVPTDNFSIGFIGILGVAILGGLLWMTFIRH